MKPPHGSVFILMSGHFILILKNTLFVLKDTCNATFFPESPVRGVLRISSDSDVRRIALCLKFSISGFLSGSKILASIFLGSLI